MRRVRTVFLLTLFVLLLAILWLVGWPPAPLQAERVSQHAAAPGGVTEQDARSTATWDPEQIDAAARGLPRLYSLLVSRRGTPIFEGYYNGARADRPANIKSASKSVVSALVGIALDRGVIPDVHTPLSTYFPELAHDADPRKRQITIEHLLTMRSGLEGTSNRNYGGWVTSRNWVRHALARPMFATPGEEMEYSTGNTHLLSAILTKAAKKSTWQFANDVLGRPLGFAFAPWPRDPQGIYFGGNDMLMTARQMLAFGNVYLNRGRAGAAQLVSTAWVERSCEGRARNRRPDNPEVDAFRRSDPMRDRKYGYGWWISEIRGHETCFAWGYGGQYIFVLPDLDMVIVTTSAPDVSEERRGHRRILFDILDRLIVAPAGVADQPPIPLRPVAAPVTDTSRSRAALRGLVSAVGLPADFISTRNLS
jgi:CubicO group peptidase (beta-lactamase class C family)